MFSTGKSLIILLLGVGMSIQGCGQDRGEFASQSNGLMYSDTDMKMLTHMVDSLNLRFKVCDNSRTFYSDPQGKLWNLEFSSRVSDLKELRTDLEKNISLEQLLHKYRAELTRVDTSLFTIEIASHQGNNEVIYLRGNPSEGYDEEYILDRIKNKLEASKWFYRFEKKDKYDSFNHIYAYQIPQPLIQKPIPIEYARYIQYVDCMIDTNSEVFLAKKTDRLSGWLLGEEDDRINKYLNSKMHLKSKQKNVDYEFISEEKVKYAKEYLRTDAAFLKLINTEVDSCIKNDCGNDRLEDLAATFISKKKALELKRHRIVVGNCSQDQAPRIHARDIAILAAETNSWDIFLRAHLDIMNDRFDRVTDGSYAYAGRKTYLKELEELNLDVVDLILGLSLRADNLAEKHYVGTVWRLGWAMSESKDKNIFEEKVIQMMKDNRLDEFNRGLLLILYHSYLNELVDMNLANEKIRLIKKQADGFPEFLKTAILKMKEREKKTL